MQKKSIAGQFTRSLLTATLVLGTLTGVLWVLQTRQIFYEEARHITNHESRAAKEQARDQVDEAVNYIGFQEDELVQRINRQVQSRVEEGYQQARIIIDRHRGSRPEAIGKAVADGLRDLRFFDGRGYYFMDTLEGVALLYPPRPELEGTSIIALTDARGQRIVEQEIALIKDQGEGFITGYWPRPQDPDSASRLKISYVKRLEPYDWYLGTGDYYDDVKAAVSQEIIRRYQKHSIVGGGRIFIIDGSGKELVERFSLPNSTYPLSEVIRTEEEKRAVIREELAYAVANPAGYSYLRSYDTVGGGRQQSAVYIRTIPRWGWTVGAEIPVEAVHAEEGWTLTQVRQRAMETLVQILAVIAFVFLVSIAVLRRQTLRLRNDFMAFMSFFKRAAKENVLIEVGDIQMHEFVSMANMANQMVAKRQEAENALLAMNEQLELQVQERTRELQESLQILESTQEQLIQSEKLSVLGNLVAGITHEINIPVGIARSLTSDLQDLIASIRSGLSEDDPRSVELHALLTRMEEDALMTEANLKRTLELVESFKEVSVDQCSGQRRPFQLQSYLEEIVLSLSARIRKGNHHVEILCDNAVEMVSYPGAFSQIVTNLIMNSLQHGFRDRVGGHITLEVIEGGDRVLLLYKDDGVGIPARYISQVYEPFFTTDREKGGSGLGLNIVHQLVTEKLGGTINLTSTEGRGVFFEIELPRVQGK